MHTHRVTAQASSSGTVIEHRHCLGRRTCPLELTLNAFGERVNGNIFCRCELPGNLQSPWKRDPQPFLQRQEWNPVMIGVIALLLSVRTLQGASSGLQNSEAQPFPEAKLYSTARIRSVSGPWGCRRDPPAERRSVLEARVFLVSLCGPLGTVVPKNTHWKGPELSSRTTSWLVMEKMSDIAAAVP